MSTCERCGGPLILAATGRPRRYCSDACRVAAWRKRNPARAHTAKPGFRNAPAETKQVGAECRVTPRDAQRDTPHAPVTHPHEPRNHAVTHPSRTVTRPPSAHRPPLIGGRDRERDAPPEEAQPASAAAVKARVSKEAADLADGLRRAADVLRSIAQGDA